MQSDRYRMGFHITPPTGWLNDPNGLCQIDGTYHAFFQYSPEWPAPCAERGWAHATSSDLVRWEHHGWAIRADAPFDASGAYSGCALVHPGAAAGAGAVDGAGAAAGTPAPSPDAPVVSFYYTGNVKEPGGFDYVHAGRQANLVRVDSPDGFEMGEKQLLMGNADYPAYCSCHVRDPKIWREEDGTGRLFMLLGARDRDGEGFVLVYASEDGRSWHHVGDVRTEEPFGYMWECPDRICLDGFEYLSCCPQGMEALGWANGVRDQAGYFTLAPGERLSQAPGVRTANFRRWDAGFDFYAPQTFVDETGRTILIAWMGLPEPPFECAPHGLDWIHCLTVPRVLTRAVDGGIAQTPVPELEAARGAEALLGPARTVALPAHRADILVEGAGEGLTVTLDDALEVRCAGGAVSLAFSDPRFGAGRTERALAVDGYGDLRILVDSSAVEVFASGGRAVFSTRWFPVAEGLIIGLRGPCERARAWPLEL